MFPYMREIDGQATRFHLRVDADGAGVLLVNATQVVRLSAAGVWMAKHLLDGDHPEAIVQSVCNHFRGATDYVVRNELQQVQGIITNLQTPGDNYPILNLSDPALTGETPLLEKPFSADVPLAGPDQLIPLLNRLWEVGIPHVTFLVPENVDPRSLVHAVERAEDLGMIAGVRGRASDLCRESLLKDLALAGVDHVNILYLSANANTHDPLAGQGDHSLAQQSLQEIVSLEVCPVAEIALVDQTLETIEETLDDLAGRGVHNVNFFAVAADGALTDDERQGALTADALLQTAALVEESAHGSAVRYLWFAPVRRDPRSTLAEQVRRGPRCSGDNSVRLEPAGEVYPARGPRESVGNLLHDNWEKIQAHPAYDRYRRRIASPTHCDQCPGLAICAADCPRSPEGWSDEGP